MTSILTNSGAIVALQTLQMINKNLDMTQRHVSTGKTINTAADGSAVWAVARIMEADVSSFKTIQAGLNVANKVVSTAFSGASKVVNSLNKIRDRISASENTDQDAKLNWKEILEWRDQIKSDIDSAQVNGVNLLKDAGTGATAAGKVTKYEITTVTAAGKLNTYAASATETDVTAGIGSYRVLASLDRSVGEVLTKTSYVDVESAQLESLYKDLETALETEPASLNDRNLLLAKLDGFLALATSEAAQLGAKQNRIQSQTETVGSLKDALTVGIGALVDTDLEAASARLKALQTQQQLGIQALSIANQSSQSVLSLFR